ncbi:protein of unknown function DUF721 [Rhodomicrobium vannielii ATCC 17100]|jgi:hypothetical protein|uniref:DUF721 domain-containing protein n=2 Tax=Rhodomicrobium vannielii TaxID=1069 RepID=E3I0B5_RHOVT|nr:protein of unknown function DUF721 [Rhodomicrobium vannielii ATCC 17100]
MAIFNQHGKSSGANASAVPYKGPVSVGRFIAPVAGKTLARGGTVMAELLAEWPAIAGAGLSSHTKPERLTKGAPEPGFEGRTPPSVLLLKVEPAKALDVQYIAPQLVERINRTLGFRAVSALRIVQGPISAKPAKPVRRAPTRSAPAATVSQAAIASTGAAPAGATASTSGTPFATPEPQAAIPQPQDRLAAALARMAEGRKARGL